MFKKTFLKVISIYLVLAILFMTLPVQGWAMFISSGRTDARQADMTAIQKTLESNVVQQRLMDLGLSPKEAMARIDKLTDQQLHQFASKLDSLQAGADGVDTLLIVLLATVIVVGVLELTGHSIIVR